MIVSSSKTRANPFVSEGFDSRVICGNVFWFRYEAIAIVSHIMFHIPGASFSDFKFGGVWIWRPKVWNSHRISRF